MGTAQKRKVLRAWKRSLAVVFVGGVLSGALIATFRAYLPRFVLAFPYSPPLLVLEALVVVHVGFWCRGLVGEPWWVWAFALGIAAQIAILFPFDPHILLPYHWSALVTIPGALLGMGVGDRKQETF